MSELSRMNDEVQENQINGDNSLKDHDPFKKQYATVLIQLKEANDQACGFPPAALTFILLAFL